MRILKNKIEIYGKYKTSKIFWGVKRPILTLIKNRRTALASYPRSGNTWLRLLIEEGTNEKTGTIYKGEGKDFAERGKKGIVIKTHKNDTHRYTDSILLIRNPLDAIESYYFWKKKRSTNQKNVEWSDHLKEAVKNWKRLTIAWQNFSRDLLIIKYENLLKDPEKELIKTLRFLGKEEVKKKKIQEAIEKTSLENLRNRFPQSGKDFFRKGEEKKSNRELFSKEEENWAIKELKELMKKYDYL